MQTMKKRAAAAALTAGLIGGGAAGMILGTTGVSGAQETTTTVEQHSGGQSTTESGRKNRSERLAETLAPLVENGTITQAQADAVIAALVEAAPTGGGRHGGRGVQGLSTAAEALGMTAEELRTALKEGQTIAQVAESKGVDVQTVIDALVAARKAKLDEKVAAGEITQAEADEKLAKATERITELVNNGFPERAERPTGASGNGATPDNNSAGD